MDTTATATAGKQAEHLPVAHHHQHVERATLMPTPASPAQPTGPAVTTPGVTAKKPRLDWAALHARTWSVDVWRCPCGGTRKVAALVTSRRAAEEILWNLGLLPPSSARPVALPQAPPQLDLLMA